LVQRVTEVRLVGGVLLAYWALQEELAYRACRASLVPKVQQVHLGCLESKVVVEHQGRLV